MAKQKSRPKRWAEAADKLHHAIGTLDIDGVEFAIDELKGIQEEYQEWLDNLPDSFQATALNEKLAALCELDFDTAMDNLRQAVEAVNIDLPMGFGRD